MKIRVVKIYEDQDDPDYIFVEADIFKSKHQPSPDDRVINRIEKKQAYHCGSPAKKIKPMPYNQEEDIENNIIEIDPNLGVFNISYFYFYMIIQNFISRLL